MMEIRQIVVVLLNVLLIFNGISCMPVSDIEADDRSVEEVSETDLTSKITTQQEVAEDNEHQSSGDVKQQPQQQVETMSNDDAKEFDDLYNSLYTWSEVELTPAAVAEYLLLSGDFADFQDALNDLVKAKILTSEEVAGYKRAVGFEFENLLKEMLQAEAKYLQMFARPLLENLLFATAESEEPSAPNDVNVDQKETEAQPESDQKEAPVEPENSKENYFNIGLDESNADIASLLEALKENGDATGKPTDKPAVPAKNSEFELMKLIEKHD